MPTRSTYARRATSTASNSSRPTTCGHGRVPADTIGSARIRWTCIRSSRDERPVYAPIRHVYGIPFGTLVPAGFANLILASPAISASHLASGSARVIPTTIEEGEAAGAAAALADLRGWSFPEIAQRAPALDCASERPARPRGDRRRTSNAGVVKRVRFAALGAAAAGAPLLAGRAARAQQLTTIRVGVPQTQDVVQVLYAQKAGLFAKAGLNVEIVPLVNGAAISAAVAGGSLEIGESSLGGLISGHIRGIPFQLIAPAGIYTSDDPYAAFIVRKDATFASGHDLEGKTLASPALKDLDWLANASWVEQNGGNFSAVKSVEMPNPTMLPALLDGRIDGFTVGEPWMTRALDSGKTRVLAKSFGAIAPRFLMTGWFATSDYVEHNRDVVERFNRALLDATVYANTHKAEIIPMLADYLKLDPALIARTMKGAEGEYLDPALIQPMIDASAKHGLIPHGFNATELISPAALKRSAALTHRGRR